MDLGPKIAERKGDAGCEPAASDGNDERLHVAELLRQLETQLPLPGDDSLVLERVDEGRARLGALVRGALRFVEPFA